MTRGPEIEQDAFEAIQGGEFLHKSHGFTVFHSYQYLPIGVGFRNQLSP